MRYMILTLLLAGVLATPALAEDQRVLFIAGGPSHGFGAHEHRGGSALLAETLNESDLNVTAEVSHGWPDRAAFEGVDTVVIYADGGGGHPMLDHLDELREVMDRGVGLVCLHYAVEVPKGDPGEALMEWIGGYFETDWSVNPHWDADFQQLPDHPITNGVESFEIRDEWYYHMRFINGGELQPILTDLPPDESLSRGDGPHSNNPHVREAVLEREEPQHVAWAYERPNGGRGFGFTGGHFHWNWGDDNFRRLVANAIVWTTGADVPESGIAVSPINVLELAEMCDDNPPANWDYHTIQERLDEANGRVTELPEPTEPAFTSEVVSEGTSGHAVDIEVEIADADQLILSIDDGGDGMGCDWANWIEPRLVDADGNETPLTELDWATASSGWQEVRINANAEGGGMRVDGREVEGIGAHAPSEIVYDLPEGHDYVAFKARGGLDDSGVSQGCGSTVRFLVTIE